MDILKAVCIFCIMLSCVANSATLEAFYFITRTNSTGGVNDEAMQIITKYSKAGTKVFYGNGLAVIKVVAAVKPTITEYALDITSRLNKITDSRITNYGFNPTDFGR